MSDNLAKQIADVKQRLADANARIPEHDVPAALIAEIDELDEELERLQALASLPDGRILVTEKKGLLRLVGQDGQSFGVIRGMPDVDYFGQGGLGDVAGLHRHQVALGASPERLFDGFDQRGELDRVGAAFPGSV